MLILLLLLTFTKFNSNQIKRTPIISKTNSILYSTLRPTTLKSLFSYIPSSSTIRYPFLAFLSHKLLTFYCISFPFHISPLSHAQTPFKRRTLHAFKKQGEQDNFFPFFFFNFFIKTKVALFLCLYLEIISN